MKIELFPFQKLALAKLRQNLAMAQIGYHHTKVPQVVSYTAPTGAGKTIIMAALIEAVYYGDENYPDQNDAIFVWLSDSPQLNEQSRIKIETKAEKCFGRCVTITDEEFDREVLEDGHIYFLNTQKLGKSSNLTKHSDARHFTIWETLQNTIEEKSDRLFFIIDEAHRGARGDRELATATTIMQKFLKGSSADNLSPMPIVIGMTATAERFNNLAKGLASTTVHYVITNVDDVRASGLLKERIHVVYSEDSGKEMAVLQVAADDWKDKWLHWEQYCREQHYAYINPIFLIQVQNGNANTISFTDMDECIRVIEDRTGERFMPGQVVHAFSEGTSTLQIHGLEVPYVEPSRIADDKRIKVVFFKETLSTGWDCPRAETMMSFRSANDYTHIAQLLGRMVRTPMQTHIRVDETLNDVHLFLPHFNRDTVEAVIKALRDTEGATIPADIDVTYFEDKNYTTLTLKPATQSINKPGQMVNVDNPNQPVKVDTETGKVVPLSPLEELAQSGNVATQVGQTVTQQPVVPVTTPQTPTAETTNPAIVVTPTDEKKEESTPVVSTIDRLGIVKATNQMGLLTYNVRSVTISNYLKSLFNLANFFMRMRIDFDAAHNIKLEICKRIHDYIDVLKQNKLYDDKVQAVLEFRLSTKIFDVFGKSIDNNQVHDLYSTTDIDIERQFNHAEAILCREGVGNTYLNEYYNEADVITNKIHVILFVNDQNSMDLLMKYAKKAFHDMNDEHRRTTIGLPEKYKKMYDSIVSDGDIVSKHNFSLPEVISVLREPQGRAFNNHLYVDNNGEAVFNLNSWETKTIEEEQSLDNFVCWLRNPPRKPWALCIPYEMDSVKKPMYPDFIVFRREEGGFGYVVDVLEPHDPTRTDNLGKAKGMAEYARQNPGVGRIQLIIVKKDSLGRERPFRLDMSKSMVRDRVLHCASNDELTHIFEEEGFFYNV